MPSLVFQDEGHIYRLDGIEIPSVTTVIKEAGLSDFSKVNPELLERACKFGTAIHTAIQLSVKGTLDHDSLDSALLPYLNQYRAFCSDFQYTPKEMEYQVFNKNLGVAGTIDQLGYIQGELTLVDIKTGHFKASDMVQVSAYGYLYPVNRVLILYLTGNGYKVQEIKRQDRKRCEALFLNALSLYNYRKKEGLIK